MLVLSPVSENALEERQTRSFRFGADKFTYRH